MYIRVTRANYANADEATVEKMLTDQVVSAMKGLPGFQHFEGGLDRANKRMLAVSIWDTAEHSEAIVSQRASFEAAGVKFDPAETFEGVTQI